MNEKQRIEANDVGRLEDVLNPRDPLVSDTQAMAARLTAAWDWRHFSAVNKQRCEEGFKHSLHSWSLSDWFTAVLGELGEAANLAKKLNRVRDGILGNKETPEVLFHKLSCELADTFVYLDLLAQSAGIDLPAAVEEVFNAKSDEIGSPIRFTPHPDLSAHVETLTQQVADSFDAGYNKGYAAGLDEATGDPRVERFESAFKAIQSATNGDYSREDHIVLDALQAGREFAVRLVSRENHIQQLIGEKQQVEQENAQLTAALKNYGGHFVTCDWHNGSCTCGLDAALAASAPQKEEQ